MCINLDQKFKLDHMLVRDLYPYIISESNPMPDIIKLKKLTLAHTDEIQHIIKFNLNKMFNLYFC